ncbi:hypothetical protein OG213_00990 [Streptomyces mirabilis]
MRLGGLGPKGDRLGLSPAATPGTVLAEVPGLDVGLVYESRTFLMTCLRGLRSQPTGFDFGVGVIAQLVLTRHAVLERHLDTQFAASLTVPRVRSSADACAASGMSLTCVTIFMSVIVKLIYVTTLGAKPRYSQGS